MLKFRLVIIILVGFLFSTQAQETNNYWSIDTTSSFNQAHNPFTDALSMWILRQNFNNITQQQDAISLKLGMKTLNNLGVILTGGYRIGNELSLYRNNDFVTNSRGKSDFFVGFNIQYLKYF